MCGDDPSHPTLLVVDDAEVADATTLAWLAWVADQRGPLLVLATARPGHDLVGERLELGPLDVDAVGELVGGRRDPQRDRDLHRRSAGNPLLAIAITAAPGDGRPATVEEAVAAIVEGLGPAAASVVQAAAVLGADVDVDLLAGVVDVPAAAVIERLEAAAGAGLLVERGAGFRFRHGAMREALQTTVGPARRALLHRHAARALDQRPHGDPLAVAVHARLGGDDAIAARAFAEAAAVSLGRADLAGAEAQLRASLRATDAASAHESLARVLMIAQRFDEADSEAALALAMGAGPSGLEIAGWVAYYRRHYDRARLYADEAATRAEPSSAVHASALALGGRIRHGTGDLRGAEERLAGAMHGPAAVRSMAEVWLGQVRAHQGRPLEALALADRALIDPDHVAHPFAALHGRFTRVMALGQLGRIGDGLRACDDLERAVERAGAVGARFPAIAMNVRAWLLRGAERLTDADELNAAALERNAAPDGAGPAGVAVAEGYWVALLDLADGRLVADDPAGAERLLVERMGALDDWDGTMAWHQRHRLGLLRSRLAMAAGDANARRRARRDRGGGRDGSRLATLRRPRPGPVPARRRRRRRRRRGRHDRRAARLRRPRRVAPRRRARPPLRRVRLGAPRRRLARPGHRQRRRHTADGDHEDRAPQRWLGPHAFDRPVEHSAPGRRGEAAHERGVVRHPEAPRHQIARTELGERHRHPIDGGVEPGRGRRPPARGRRGERIGTGPRVDVPGRGRPAEPRPVRSSTIALRPGGRRRRRRCWRRWLPPAAPPGPPRRNRRPGRRGG